MTAPRTFFALYARRPSDFAVVEVEYDDEMDARRAATYHYANGYEVTVHFVVKSLVAEWKQEKADE